MADTLETLLTAKSRRGFQFTNVYNNIDGDGSLYMKQVKLCSTPFGCLWLHVFVNKDTGTLLHDHPMDFVSFILWGGYDETVAAACICPACFHHTTSWNAPFTMQRRSARCMHKVDIRGKLAITLVWKGKPYRDFGFLHDRQWVHGPSFIKTWERTKDFNVSLKAGAEYEGR